MAIHPRLVLLPLLLVFGVVACADRPEPALVVGPVAYPPAEVAGFSAEQLALLADLTSLGLAVASDSAERLVQPLAAREAERARLQTLPYLLGARRAGLSEEDLRKAYTADPGWELRVRHVVRLVPRWASAAARGEARRVAAEVERRARAGEDFAALAAQLSEEPGAAERGGLLEPGREGSWVDPFWEAALALRPGETSPVVETEYGYHVLRLEDRRPVPFESADRAALLARVVPAGAARAAMEEWAPLQPLVALDPPAVLAAREALGSGSAPDSLVIARLPSGRPYSAADLAAAWAALPLQEREALRGADDLTFGQWAADEVRDAAWTAAASQLGAEVPAGVETEAGQRWAAMLERWAGALGLRQGMSVEQIRAAALGALTSTDQEARIARAELRPVRPFLRRFYSPSGAAVSPDSESSSEIR